MWINYFEYNLSLCNDQLIIYQISVINHLSVIIPLTQIGSMAPIPCAPHTKDPGTIPPKLGEKNAVIVSHINDLTDFWIQYRATEKNLSR